MSEKPVQPENAVDRQSLHDNKRVRRILLRRLEKVEVTGCGSTVGNGYPPDPSR